jgi:hypothetical protein
MKSPVVVTLIVMGALLVLTPLLFGYLREVQLAQLIALPGTSVNLERGISETYSWLCMFIGIALIVTGGVRCK